MYGVAIFHCFLCNLLPRLIATKFMLFNILERRFNIFGFPFLQDFLHFVLFMIVGAL
jgi:hypothetical protein